MNKETLKRIFGIIIIGLTGIGWMFGLIYGAIGLSLTDFILQMTVWAVVPVLVGITILFLLVTLLPLLFVWNSIIDNWIE